MISDRKDAAAGLFFIAAGLLYGGIAWFMLPIGSALRMGPGYFPIVLSGLLVLLGAAIVARAFVHAEEMPFGAVPWRALGLISLATTVFAAFIEDLGMIPGVFVTTAIASLAGRKIRLSRVLVASALMAVFCTLVFSYAVRLPIPVIGPFFSGW